MAGIAGSPAPELRVPQWLSPAGESVSLADIEEPLIYLYAFQSWCPGCHSHGFPTLKATKDALEQDGLADSVKFIAVQTVFEGFEENTPEAALKSVADHGLTDIPLGHDAGEPPTIMADYATGGTPWIALIGPRPERRVLFDGFGAEPEPLYQAIKRVLTEIK